MKNKPLVMVEYDLKCKLYKNFTLEIKHQLENILDAEGIVYNAITFRVKDRESLSEKIDRKNDKYILLSSITDIAGVRVITYYAEDVDKVAEIVEREFVVDRENSIDKRDALEPDRFGYCSVHYVVEMSQERLKLRENRAYNYLKCEIQIRSVLQHAWAEIEHDLGYKSPVAIPKGVRRSFSRLAGLLEIADKEFQQIRSFLQSYQNEATEKVESEEFQNKEIDAILLQAIITTNSDIKAINEIIADCLLCPFSRTISTAFLEHSINILHWFDIYTVFQLNDCIEKNKDNAAIIAKKFCQKRLSNENTPQIAISQTGAITYICFAEAARRNLNYDLIMLFFKECGILPNIGSENAARYLLQLSKKTNK